MLLLIIVGASGSLEEQAKSFITYASIRAGIVVFCGLKEHFNSAALRDEIRHSKL